MLVLFIVKSRDMYRFPLRFLFRYVRGPNFNRMILRCLPQRRDLLNPDSSQIVSTCVRSNYCVYVH